MAAWSEVNAWTLASDYRRTWSLMPTTQGTGIGFGPPSPMFLWANFLYKPAARWVLRLPAYAKSGALRRPVCAASWHVFGNRGSPLLIEDPRVSLGPSHSACGAFLWPSTLLGFSFQPGSDSGVTRYRDSIHLLEALLP